MPNLPSGQFIPTFQLPTGPGGPAVAANTGPQVPFIASNYQPGAVVNGSTYGGATASSTPINSIYTRGFDSRYGNPLINQQTGAYQPYQASSLTNPTGSTTGGSATGVGGYSPGAAPDLSSLTSMINQLNLQGQQAANAGRIPGEQGLENQSSQNIGQELAGQLPSDVINLLQQQSAERGVATGSPGSDNSNAAYLRALGLTSLGQEQTGQANLTSALARNPGAPIFNPESQLLTPAQAGQLNLESQRNTLDWFRALQGLGGAGGGRGGGQPTTQDTATTPSPNWFNNLMGGTPSPADPPASGAVGVTQDPNYPGTSVPGLTNLTNILGTADPGYGLSPDPYGQATTPDASNPSYWDFTGGVPDGGYDPFSQL